MRPRLGKVGASRSGVVAALAMFAFATPSARGDEWGPQVPDLKVEK
jgi:hypothetical protein